MVYAILEGLFAHGQVYVQISRTPMEMDFLCVGVPPRDIFCAVVDRVKMKQRVISKLCSEWDARHDHENDTQACDEFVEEAWRMLDQTLV